MKRIIDYYLDQWRLDLKHKPLLIRGARQIGKTYSIRQLGKKFKHYVEINFEKTPQAKEIFVQDLEPQRIIKELSLFSGKQITPNDTLLFLDEIQEAPQAIAALRYFYENSPQLHVIAAGSLIDFALEHISIPVGRISFLYMHPISFLEFLRALDQKLLITEILEHTPDLPLSEPVHQKLLNYLGDYIAVGGMPEAVQHWIETQKISGCKKIHQEIISTYQQDFQKYTKKYQLKYVELLFNQIPRSLGTAIKFQTLSETYRKRELLPCLELLNKANIIWSVHHSSGNGIPLGAEINLDKFKLIFLDIALCQSILGLDSKGWILGPQAEFINKGEIAEAFVGQELLAYAAPNKKPELYYWHRETRGSSAEVDYLIQMQNDIIPIEVKSKLGNSLKSAHLFLESHPHSPFAIRISMHNYSIHQKIKSFPLYAVAGILDKNEGLMRLNDEIL